MCVVAILDHQLLMIAALYDAAVLITMIWSAMRTVEKLRPR